MSLRYDIFILAMGLFSSAFFFLTSLIIGFNFPISLIILVVSGITLINYLYFIITQKPKLVFDDKGILYLSFPFMWSGYDFIPWESLSTFEYLIKNSDSFNVCYIVLEKKFSTRTVRIRISYLEVDPDVIITEFRSIARKNKVSEFKIYDL